MRRRLTGLLAAAGVLALLGSGSAALGAGPSSALAGGHSDRTSAEVSDHAHDRFQPAYFQDHTVTYEAFIVPQETPAPRQRVLYGVEYPRGWEQRLARPLCTYCDHISNGKDAYDFHDHVLASLPTRAQNSYGNVYWRVHHVSPAYTGNARRDAAIGRRYASLLPAQSAEEVRRLLDARLGDGARVAKNVDTGFYFRGPLTRWPD